MSTAKQPAYAPKRGDGTRDTVAVHAGTAQVISDTIDRIFAEPAKPARLVPLGDVLIQAKFSGR
jgi:hypothetical protein